MLEDELTHVLAEDRELKHLIVVDTPESQWIARKLRAQNRPFLTAEFAQIPNLVKKEQGNGASSRPDRMVRTSVWWIQFVEECTSGVPMIL